MKMRKIMAAGIAATMAVTSLAAVASAESLTFNMGSSQSKQTVSGKAYYFTDNTQTIDNVDADSMIRLAPTNKAVNNDGAKYETLEGATLTVKGKKAEDDSVTVTQTYNFVKGNDGCLYLVFSKNEYVNQEGYFNLGFYGEIHSAEINVTASHMCYGLEDYNIHNGIWGDMSIVADLQILNVADASADALYSFSAWDSYINRILGNECVWDNTLNASRKANETELATAKDAMALYVTGAGADADENASKVYNALNTSTLAASWINASSEKKDLYALLKRTTTNATIMRADIWELSDTDAHKSVNDLGTTDDNQSYDADGLGTSKNRFAGLASQVADFFNHKTNGTITFTFETQTAADSGWLNGGVPSTQIGIKNLLDANNFALYVNYETSTGSLEATTSVDKNSGTVTFDISEILADLGGQTKGVVTDLYYGLNQGIQYGDDYGKGIGLLVKEVTLAYEDEAAEDEVIEDEVVEEEEEVVEEEEEVVEEEEEEVVEEEEEEEVTIEEEEEEVTEEEEEEVDGEMFEEEETEEEDVNPGTGVALAVVPAMIAAAAAVVSKKRK